MEKKNNLLDSVIENLRISRLNSMQIAALAPEVQNKDLVLLSPTGSGKTLAYLLPLLRHLDSDNSSVQVLVLAPSRELAIQIDFVFKSLGTKFKSCCCYGGHSIAEEKKYIFNNAPAVIVGTPGRITDHLSKGVPATDSIHTLIIDEFDKSLEFGFEEEMSTIVSLLTHLNRRVLVSATDMDNIPRFCGLVDPVKLDFLSEDEEERLKVYRVLSPTKDKIETLYNLLCSVGNQSNIVFCNHRESVERVYSFLKDKGIYCEMYHGGMEQQDRERALYKFNNGSSYTLISTDLASRGLDINDIRHIIHYHLPVNEEACTHRNGRTARWDQKGNAYFILNGSDAMPGYIPETAEEYTFPIDIPSPAKPKWITLYIGKGKKDKISKIDIVGFLHKKAKLGREDVGIVEIRDHYSFVSIAFHRFKQTLNLIQGEKIKGIKTIIEQSK